MNDTLHAELETAVAWFVFRISSKFNLKLSPLEKNFLVERSHVCSMHSFVMLWVHKKVLGSVQKFRVAHDERLHLVLKRPELVDLIG
jgi:hypothetical protein